MSKVLVVDDIPDMAQLIKQTVEDHGYTALVACDAVQALRTASVEHPDAILLDIMMPGMSGMEVLRRLKSDPDTRSVPVILVTAKGERQDVIAGLDEGAHDYVTKPFEREILAARIRSAVRTKQDHDCLRELNQRLHREIRKRERMQQELAQAKKLESIGHLAAGIAHEINTPAQYVGDNIRFLQEVFTDINNLITCFNECLDAAREESFNDELVAKVEIAARKADVAYLTQEVPKAIDQSLEGIGRVAKIVRAMKEFSHPISEEKQPIDLNRLIDSTLTVSRNEWKYVADLETDYDPELPLVPCLAGEFNQAILNLVVNASQAISEIVGDGSEKRGTITVRTRLVENWAEIRIEDTGTGIPEDIREKIFDHFFTTKEVGEGTGQGLTITHSIIVEKHGGTITFDTSLGKGTAFIIRLPIFEVDTQKENSRVAVVATSR